MHYTCCGILKFASKYFSKKKNPRTEHILCAKPLYITLETSYEQNGIPQLKLITSTRLPVSESRHQNYTSSLQCLPASITIEFVLKLVHRVLHARAYRLQCSQFQYYMYIFSTNRYFLPHFIFFIVNILSIW